MSRRGSRTMSRNDGWEGWGGYMNAKRQKLHNQYEQIVPSQLRKEDSGGSKLFDGVTIYVNGYTKPSSDELKRLILLHGGSYEHYLFRTRVSHVIATNLTNSKVKEIRGLKVVRPEWITQSVAAGKLLPYTKYLLYTAQTSGLQKGLQSFTVEQDTCMKENINQSVPYETESLDSGVQSLERCRTESFESGVQSFESDSVIPKIKMQSLDSGMESFESTGSILPKSTSSSTLVHGQRNTVSNIANKTSPLAHSAASAGDPKFLNEFYSNSRLHFLSTWKAEFKNYVNELQSKGGNFQGREELRKLVFEREATPGNSSQSGDNYSVGGRGTRSRCVMHIDMDCFFVSVGLRKRPDLKGKPVAVTHSKGRGAPTDPEADLNFEKREWEKMKRGKKGKQNTNSSVGVITNEGDLCFPDQSDSDTDDDVIDDVTSVSMATTESFHSMAEIASCSYEARKAGVKNGMYMGKAKQLCPNLVTISYDFDGYNTVSRILYDTVASFTHDIEAVSCDEMLVDCTDVLTDTGATPLEFAALLRQQIYEKAGCHASAGLGSNILLAKMATRKAKPNGQFHLTEDLVQGYIKDQPIRDIPGVGWSLSKRFESMKVSTCGDLQRHSLDTLQKEFGPKTGQSLYRYCRGQDDRPIQIEHQRKSVSAEVNYGIRFTSDSEAATFLAQLSEEVCTRLKNINMKGKTITLKVMVRRPDAPKQTSKFMGHGICNNLSKSVTLPMATDEPRIVGKETAGLLKQMKADAVDLRGIGIQLQKLEPVNLGAPGKHNKFTSILNFTVTKSTPNPTNPANSSIPTGSTSVSGLMTSPAKKSLNVASTSDVIMSLDTGHGREHSDQLSVSKLKNIKSSEGIGTLTEHSNCATNSVGKLTLKSTLDQGSPSERTAVGIEASGLSDKIATTRVNFDDEEIHYVGKGHEAPRSQAKSMDLLKDLGSRHANQEMLPPLPCLPDIKTPESGKKSTRERTPVDSPVIETQDYFPSPSQVDPDVLRELPSDIRQQIEKEMSDRRKVSVKKSSTRVTSLAPSCSHWQESRGDNASEGTERSNSVSERGENSGKDSNLPHKKDDNMAAVKADNSVDHSQDAIVALPSPSQIDPSCLEALPESLQAEIRAAYAVKSSETREPNRGGNFLNLQQASPNKSPNKRSPSKRSPNFKVPRGRPRGRGRGRGGSKKNLFRGSVPVHKVDIMVGTSQDDHTVVDSIDNSRITSTQPAFTNEGSIDNNSSNDRSSDYAENFTNMRAVDDDVTSELASEIRTNMAFIPKDADGVNLCGAVDIKEVRLLLREWIQSTPCPQNEDEVVLVNYLNELILDQNLEQVDLVLKYILRNVKQEDNEDWFPTLQRIFEQTQSVVYNLYGSRLRSISL